MMSMQLDNLRASLIVAFRASSARKLNKKVLTVVEQVHLSNKNHVLTKDGIRMAESPIS